MRKNDLFDWIFPAVTGESVVSGWSKNYLVKEEKDKWVLCFLAPGLEKKDLKISLKKSILSVKWQIPEKTPAWELGVLDGHYTFSVDVRVLPENIKATFSNGILTVEVAKPQEVQQLEKESFIPVA